MKNLSTRGLFALISLGCIALLAFGLYLQHARGLEPCPMCIVQRYAFILIAVLSGLTAFSARKSLQVTGSVLLLLCASLGAFVAARQSWLQWYPPQEASCGRDFYGMVEMFPLSRVIPMIFQGSGDCTRVDWTFLGLSIANWSVACFALLVVLSVALLRRCLCRLATPV